MKNLPLNLDVLVAVCVNNQLLTEFDGKYQSHCTNQLIRKRIEIINTIITFKMIRKTVVSKKGTCFE